MTVFHGRSWPVMAASAAPNRTSGIRWRRWKNRCLTNHTAAEKKPVDNIGIALTGITAAGIAAHAVASGVRHKGGKE